MKKNVSIATKFSISVVVVIVLIVAILLSTVAFFFKKASISNFYTSSSEVLSEFSNLITTFFNSKETELNVFAESEEVKACDDTIHSYVNEVGTIQILGYKKSPTEEKNSKTLQNFCKK